MQVIAGTGSPHNQKVRGVKVDARADIGRRLAWRIRIDVVFGCLPQPPYSTRSASYGFSRTVPWYVAPLMIPCLFP